VAKLFGNHFVLRGRTLFNKMITSLNGKSVQMIHTTNMIYNGRGSKGDPVAISVFWDMMPCSVVDVY
jgi:hypothetical protein